MITIVEGVYKLNSLLKIDISIHAQMSEVELIRQCFYDIKNLLCLAEDEYFSRGIILFPFF
jgi:hypothetical protein